MRSLSTSIVAAFERGQIGLLVLLATAARKPAPPAGSGGDAGSEVEAGALRTNFGGR